MSENVSAFAWDRKKERAAQLLAEDELTVDEVAADVKVAPRTLWRWLAHPDFKARVEALAAAVATMDRRRAIARRARRVQALDDRWRRLQEVIAERAADPALRAAPGGRTGLVVRTQKALGSGDQFRVVEEYAVDTGLLRELREHERQAAQELGQWAEKREVSGAGGAPLVVQVLGGQASLEDL